MPVHLHQVAGCGHVLPVSLTFFPVPACCLPPPAAAAEGYGTGSVVHFYRLTMMPPPPHTTTASSHEQQVEDGIASGLKRTMSPRTPRSGATAGDAATPAAAGAAATSPRQRRGRSSAPSSPCARSRTRSASRAAAAAAGAGSPSADDVSSRLKAQWAGPHKIYGFLAVCNHEDGTVSGGLSVYQEVQERLVTLEVGGRYW
jgi:hypothetical protein